MKNREEASHFLTPWACVKTHSKRLDQKCFPIPQKHLKFDRVIFLFRKISHLLLKKSLLMLYKTHLVTQHWDFFLKTERIPYLTLFSGHHCGNLCCCRSVTNTYIKTLCNSTECSMPASPVLHNLPELSQTHVVELVMPSA